MWDIRVHIHNRRNVRDLAANAQNKVLVTQLPPPVQRVFRRSKITHGRARTVHGDTDAFGPVTKQDAVGQR